MAIMMIAIISNNPRRGYHNCPLSTVNCPLERSVKQQFTAENCICFYCSSSPIPRQGMGKKLTIGRENASGQSGWEKQTIRKGSMGKYITKSLILFCFPAEYIDIWPRCAIMNPISIGKSLSKARYYRPPGFPAKAIRTAGSNAEDRKCGWQLLLPYWLS